MAATVPWCRWAGSGNNNQIDVSERLFRMCGDMMRHAYGDNYLFGVLHGSPSFLTATSKGEVDWS
ncbi:hypothetical protein BS78_02G136800 [Paspalum vaginatum]|nr:hypothetical protein BS78_02G136800 [Paspalum vaginatum]KAJ1289072.1 hypothetical protein BS78_02G136800 [Paspalum vaginatum]